MRTFLLLGLVTAVLSMPSHANLIVNGDFSGGNSGFTSQYTYNSTVYADGEYTVGTDPYLAHAGAASFGDHTTGAGMMLLANGAIDTSRVVWEQTINVADGLDYLLSGWTASWGTFSPGVLPDPSPSILRVFINGSQIGSDIDVPGPNGQWSQFSVTWNSGTSTTAVLQVFDINPEPIGNDFALDDLSFAASRSVPEPGSLGLLGAALIGAIALRQRRQ